MHQLCKKKFQKLLLSFWGLLFILSCSINQDRYGKVTLHNTGNRNSFIFTISEDFLEKNRKDLNKEAKDIGAKISIVEYNFLKKLLKEKKFCFNENNDLDFTIVSRQEKIYDMTFSHLIATSYKARPLAPRSYFGECKIKNPE